MRNENRNFKNGKKIAAVVKAYSVVTKKEIVAGRLNKRGTGSKLVANVIPKKTVPVDQVLSLRIAYRKMNGNLLIYLHSFGWIETTDAELNNLFIYNNGIMDIDQLIDNEYRFLSLEQKLILIQQNFPEELVNLTKTEQMLLAFLNGKDLNEAEKEIGIDKSMKYKIKKHTEKYKETFIKKMETKLA
jgi:hypothetical protein